ncbi:MAG: VOC family protein [Planctomycetota bacterium]|nr:VOC family protein [Planctomycetota bacterium]
MDSEITRLVAEFEAGKTTRRELVARLGTLVAVLGGAGRLLASSEKDEKKEKKSTFEGVGLNHIALRVTDVARSRDFYIKHLGLKVARQGRNNCFLNCGKNFVALFRADEAQMDHYCYSIKDYDVDVAERKLKAEGFNPRVHREGKRIYFKDPDGLTVQLSSDKHRP